MRIRINMRYKVLSQIAILLVCILLVLLSGTSCDLIVSNETTDDDGSGDANAHEWRLFCLA